MKKKSNMKLPKEALTANVIRMYESGIPLHKALAMDGLDKKYIKKENKNDDFR